MMTFAISHKKVHYAVVGAPLTFCGIDLRYADMFVLVSTTTSFKHSLAETLKSRGLCKRCGKAHIKQMEVAMGVG